MKHFLSKVTGNDFFHWRDGESSISKNIILFQGKLSRGPDYTFCLAKKITLDDENCLKEKKISLKKDDNKSFNEFCSEPPKGIKLEQYNSIVIWRESFSEFFTQSGPCTKINQ